MKLNGGLLVTTIHLVRHAAHDLVTRVLVGRNDDVVLSTTGHRQARGLANLFGGQTIVRVQSSPQPRARQTAEPIAAQHGLRVELVPELDELDAGHWSGRAFADLEDDPMWRRWNCERSAGRPPGGETMGEVALRASRHLRRMHAEQPGRCVVMVTHAEVIRAVVLHHLRRSFDDFLGVPIEPASVTTIRLHRRGADIVDINACLEDVAAA